MSRFLQLLLVLAMTSAPLCAQTHWELVWSDEFKGAAGLDVYKRQSLGNAIGINEPPLEMYGKVMSISDEMMWRYYELLTDVQVAGIEKMKRETHPMQAKKELARRIVGDFHSAEAAAKAAEDWAKQFQKNEIPQELDCVDVRLADVVLEGQGGGAVRVIARQAVDPGDRYLIRVDKLIRQAGLSNSNTEAATRVKSGAVTIDGESIGPEEFLVYMAANLYAVLRVGRRIKKVRLITSQTS